MNKNIKPIFIAVFILFEVVSFGQRSSSQSVKFKKISDSLYEILGGRGTQMGAYIGDNGVLLIDAKMDKSSVVQVIEGIRKLTDKPIKYLVNTHSDGDHIVGNRYFPQTVTFVAHENCRKDLFRPVRRGTPSEWTRPELSPFVPSVTFRDKMDIYLGSKRVELWYFGVGHTTGDIVVYFPKKKIAFVGDQIFLTRPQLIHSHKGGNSFEHVKTLAKMLETIDAEKFCSGHSEMTDRAWIRSHIARMKERQKKVKALMREGKNLEQIKGQFEGNEGRLVESIYRELTGPNKQELEPPPPRDAKAQLWEFVQRKSMPAVSAEHQKYLVYVGKTRRELKKVCYGDGGIFSPFEGERYVLRDQPADGPERQVLKVRVLFRPSNVSEEIFKDPKKFGKWMREHKGYGSDSDIVVSISEPYWEPPYFD
jgi:glyoxylase-like metal-dependent hydrolase (beta-lactamase superfamily II)